MLQVFPQPTPPLCSESFNFKHLIAMKLLIFSRTISSHLCWDQPLCLHSWYQAHLGHALASIFKQLSFSMTFQKLWSKSILKNQSQVLGSLCQSIELIDFDSSLMHLFCRTNRIYQRKNLIPKFNSGLQSAASVICFACRSPYLRVQFKNGIGLQICFDII